MEAKCLKNMCEVSTLNRVRDEEVKRRVGVKEKKSKTSTSQMLRLEGMKAGFD